jgi:sacsin
MAEPAAAARVWSDFGQKVDLTARIREVLAAYPDGGGILKELIQNADDAGAREVRVCLDRRPHVREAAGLLFPLTAAFQGEALMVFNDATFSEADFESIQRIGNSKKQGALGKTGRFGIGFNSVYHLTDLPSFVSASKLAVFDPHCEHLPDPSFSNPGKIVDFVKNPVAAAYPAQFEPYRAFGCTLEQPFAGTLFRFPLRTAAQAARSRLSAHAYSADRILELVADFRASAAATLLFLQHVQHISLHVWEAGAAEPELRFTACVVGPTDALRADRRLLRTLADPGGGPAGGGAPSVLFELRIETREGEAGAAACSAWLVSQLMGGGEAASLAERVRGDRLGLHLLPWAGVAAQLEPAPDVAAALQGRAYCFLPLPVRTGLPVHVNGAFELSANRRDVWFGRDMTGDGALRSDWNVALLRDVVAPAYTRMLKQAADGVGWHEQYFPLWPAEIVADTWSFVTRQV